MHDYDGKQSKVLGNDAFISLKTGPGCSLQLHPYIISIAIKESIRA